MTHKSRKSSLFQKIIFPLLCVFVLVFIWGNSYSMQDFVNNDKNFLTDVFAKIVYAITHKEISVGTAGTIISKTGHICEFALFSFFLSFSFKAYTGKIKPHIPTFLFITLLCGVIDELIQLYSPGRFSRAADSLIDLCGGIIGILFALLIQKIRRRKK